MKFAIVDGQRREAQPGHSGKCPACGAAMTPKCGEIRVRHWAHLRRSDCDRWWESETEWHRAWKNQFPVEWQEIVQHAENGEKHIADVKTARGVVIEFQHSHLRAEERRSREAFYRGMVWVVDGLRLERDRPNFERAVRDAAGSLFFVASLDPLTICVPSKMCGIFRNWADSRVPVFLDFGAADDLEDIFQFEASVLWRLDPNSPDGLAYLAPIYRADFVEAVRSGAPYNGMAAAKVLRPHLLPPPPATGTGQRRRVAHIARPARLPPLRYTREERLAARKAGIRLQRRL